MLQAFSLQQKDSNLQRILTHVFLNERELFCFIYTRQPHSPLVGSRRRHIHVSCNTRPRTFPPPRCYTSFLRSQWNAVWNVMYLFSFLCVTVAGYLLSFNSLSVNNAGTMVVSTEKHDFRKYFQCWIPLLSNCEGATVYCMHFICYLWCIIL